MCGITGFITTKALQDNTIQKMVNELYHRGPDEEGYYKYGHFTGGMRRLSINDLNHGSQPLFNQDKTIVVLYNGEIYNYPVLKQLLLEKGYIFSTHSDGEVICHLFDYCGEDAFNMLEGMFAISLWDEKNQKLYIVRDYVGEKPLYYSILPNNELVYASEIKALKHFTPLKRELNRQAIWDFVSFLWIPEPATIYENVFALMPGHFIVADGKDIKIQKYSSLDITPSKKSRNILVSKTKELVLDGINSRLLSDVPLGCFLSGGIDSSIIAAIASQKIDNLRTYTIGFEKSADPYGGTHDESTYAADFARQLGTQHTTIRVTSQDFRNALEEVVYCADQPFGVSSGIGVFLIAKKAREDGVKVLLSGDGADEMFGGYSWYQYLDSLEHHKTVSNHSQEDDFSFHNSYKSVAEKLEKISTFGAQKKAWAWHYYASEYDKTLLFSENMQVDKESSLRYFTLFNQDASWKAIDYIRHDRIFYLPNEMLKKADRMGMGASVEIRVPFISKDILTFTESLDYSDLVYNGELKSLLKEAFKSDLPKDILTRPKHGFNVPIDSWLKHEWADMIEETFGDKSLLKKLDILAHSIAPSNVQSMLHDKNRLHGHTILCFIMLNMWLKKEMEI